MTTSDRSSSKLLPCRRPRGGLLALIALAFIASASPAIANSTRMLIPFPAGGAADFMGRLLADKLKAELNRNVIIENRPGAGTRLAADALKRATPDGNTVLLAALEPLLIAPAVYSNVKFDVATDFAPITDVAAVQFGLAVSSASPYKTAAQYVQAAASDRDQAMLGITSLGTIGHFFAFDFVTHTKADLALIPFQGGPALMTNLIGGQVPAIFDATTVFTEQHHAQKIRVLAVSGTKRASRLPDVPTFAESGYPSLTLTANYVLYAPVGTPAAEVAKWNAAVRKVLAMPDVRSKLEQAGYEVATGSSPEDTRRKVQQIGERILPLVKASNFKGD